MKRAISTDTFLGREIGGKEQFESKKPIKLRFFGGEFDFGQKIVRYDRINGRLRAAPKSLIYFMLTLLRPRPRFPHAVS